jgi:hypothetical protein
MVGPPYLPLAPPIKPEHTAGRLMRSSVLGGRADIDFGQILEPRWIRLSWHPPKSILFFLSCFFGSQSFDLHSNLTHSQSPRETQQEKKTRPDGQT